MKMKRFISLLLVGMVCIPTAVFAKVDINTRSQVWDPADVDKCYAEEKLNTDDLSKASDGYYLYCVKMTCTSGKNVYSIENKFSDKVTCANGNKNPYAQVEQSAGSTDELVQGAACATDGIFKYGTEKISYNCAQVADSNGKPAEYKATSTSGNDSSSVKNSKTGVEDYYITLGTALLVLSAGLYVINKKNIFKKI